MTPPATVAPATAAPASPAAPSGSTADRLVLIVAPANGRFRPAVTQGFVDAGAVVAQVTGGRGRAADVLAPVAAVVEGLLTRPGQLVSAGQALAWARIAESV